MDMGTALMLWVPNCVPTFRAEILRDAERRVKTKRNREAPVYKDFPDA
jgi:hypothetical protein